MPRVLVPLAEGFEEIEAITVVDLLRRAGIEVHTASLTGTVVRGSHGIAVEADIALDAAGATDFDMIVLPGIVQSEEPVVVDGKVVTSRGPGTAIEFSLVLIELLCGKAAADAVGSRLQRPAPAR